MCVCVFVCVLNYVLIFQTFEDVIGVRWNGWMVEHVRVAE